jgi:hypothetical protein
VAVPKVLATLVLLGAGFLCWLLCLMPAEAQRVVVLCLYRADVPSLVRETATMQGAQALVLSRVASSAWMRKPPLSLERWERSAYLTLNTGTRAIAPEGLSPAGSERLEQLREANRRWGYPVVVGLLPDTLKRHGVTVRYLSVRHDSPMLLVGAPFPEPDARIVSDLPALLEHAQSILRAFPRVMLWCDVGDLAPASLEPLARRLQTALTAPADALYLLSAVPSPNEAARGSRLGWVMRLDTGGQGVLSSPSTRQPGFILLPDLTVTWLAHFRSQPPPSAMTGLPIRAIPHAQAGKQVQRLYDSLMRQDWWNRAVGALPTGQLVVLLLAWLMWYRWGQLVRGLWLFPCLLPVLGVSLVPVLLCLPLGGLALWARGAFWAVCLGSLLVILSRFSLRQSLQALAMVLVVFVGVDLLRGGDLVRWSGFGYVLQEGARFYGVGNEMAGSLFGAQSGFLWTEGASWSLLRWGMTALAMGAPFWGANTGAMLSALGVAMARGMRIARWRWWIVGATLALLLAVVMWEVFSPMPSHLGRFLQQPQQWLPTVGRKLSMNLSLLVSSAWTPLLLFGLCGLKGAPMPVWVGAVLLLLFNDSGVVAAAAMLVWWWAWRMALAEENKAL